MNPKLVSALGKGRGECSLEPRLFAAVTGELRAKTIPQAHTLLYLNSGPGNGFGMSYVIGSQIFGGVKGLAGNFGHLHIVPDDERCYC